MYSLEVEAYYKTTDNRIDYIDGSDLIGTNNIETEILNGESRAYGLEFLARKNEGKFTGWFAYTLENLNSELQGARQVVWGSAMASGTIPLMTGPTIFL
jgi:hypothetical protein